MTESRPKMLVVIIRFKKMCIKICINLKKIGKSAYKALLKMKKICKDPLNFNFNSNDQT